MSKSSAARAEVHVVGGGPAGAATAIALARRGVTVTVGERAKRLPPHGGESLPPAITPLFAQLGVLAAFERGPHLVSHGHESAWGGDQPRLHSFMTSPYGRGWHIDRAALDSVLLDAAVAAGARVVAGDEPTPSAAFVVDATGRHACVARARGAERVHVDHLIAVVGVLQTALDGSCSPTSLVEATAHGYWYSAPLPFGRLLCTYQTDPASWSHPRSAWLPAWHELLRETRHTGARAAAHQGLLSLRVVAAGTGRLTAVHGQGWLAVGDAAASRDPLCSGGIYEAVRSGLRAADALARHFDGDAGAVAGYAADVEDRFARDLVRRRDIYGWERRWSATPFWAVRHRRPPSRKQSTAATTDLGVSQGAIPCQSVTSI